MIPDPNWLLSAVVQSSAAIVAIVGGFISTRLIGIVAEKNSLRNRQKETGMRIERFQNELDNVREIYDLNRVSDFLDGALDPFNFVKLGEAIPELENLLKRKSAKSLNREMLIEEYEKRIQRIRKAFEWFSQVRDLVEASDREFNDWTNKIGADISGDIDIACARLLYEKGRDEKKEESKRLHRNNIWADFALPDLHVSSLLDLAPLNVNSRVEIDREEAMRGRIEDLEFQLRMSNGEFRDIQYLAANLKFPRMSWIPFIILLYLAGIGIIYPMQLMPAYIIAKSSWNVVVVGFSVGLVGLILYFLAEMVVSRYSKE
jgi:hypothetical protein